MSLPTGNVRHAGHRTGREESKRHGADSAVEAVPRQPRGPGRRHVAGPRRARDGKAQLPHHPRGDGDKGRGRSSAGAKPQRGVTPPSARSDDGGGRPVRSAAALRPYARALVALAREVRAEGVALPGEQRSHGPIGRGGGRCAV